MSIIVQSCDGETVTTLAEFAQLGDGVKCHYHSETFRRQIELNGVWTEATGQLFPSDGEAFLDALPIAFANSSRIRVIDNHDDKRTDYYDPEKATQPDPNTPPKPMVLNDDEAGATGPDMNGRPLVPPAVAKKIKSGRGRSGTPAATKAPPGLGKAAPGEVVPAPARKKKPGAAPPPPPGMHSDDDEE